MKRAVLGALAGVLALSLASAAMAQTTTPQNVVRMGDWVEVGDDLFLNFIATLNIAYRTTHNADFEGDLQDRTGTTDSNSSLHYANSGDFMWAETRLGFDFRYRKNLTAQVLLEAQTTYDGTIIDQTDEQPYHPERFWIDYKFEDTPFRMRVGAWLYSPDIAQLRRDDDPGLHVWAEFGNFEVKFGAIIEQESALNPGRTVDTNLTNDNDNIHYELLFNYESKPHRFCLCLFWDRDRTESGKGQTETDYFQVVPGWQGTLGPVEIMAQGMIGFGQAKDAGFDNIVDPAARPTRDELDIFTWAVVAAAQIDLGMIRPAIGVVVGSGDDDPGDDALNGYNTFTTPEVGGLSAGTSGFSVADDGFAVGGTDRVFAPAGAPIGGGTSFKTINTVFLDRTGTNAHADVQGGTSANPAWTNTPLSNPGILQFMAGAEILPMPAHTANVWYAYTMMMEPDLLTKAGEAGVAAYREAITGNVIDFSRALFHEVGASWTWKLNKHFSMRARGFAVIPADGVKDIARTVACGAQPCEGEDVALAGEFRFAATF